MGNCSCFHGPNDEKQLTAERMFVELERKVLRSFERSFITKPIEVKEKSASIVIDECDVIKAQSLLRAYIERRKLKNFMRGGGKIPSNRAYDQQQSKPRGRKNSFDSETTRPEIRELSIDNITDYSSPTLKLIQAKLGQFIYGEYSCTETITKKGPVEMENKAIYVGEWNSNNLRHGIGNQIWNDGSMYEGYWANDKPNGKGRFIYTNGDVYEGEWENDKAHGKGIYIYADGVIYDGCWQNDKQHGKGIETWPDGARYKGMYADGQKNGFGKFEWADGSNYEGMFSDNNINGFGTYVWNDSRKFLGDWKDNKMHGKGRFTWIDGRSYEGDYFEDKRHGFGIFIWPDGRKYEGGWADGKQHGKGIYTTLSKSKEGEWIRGKRLNTLS